MSEYQYYEFQTVDRPLTRDEMNQLRALSTRAVIMPTHFTNTYHWGDFRGNPRKMVETYFDAHVYVSNWGTVTLMLRLARGVLSNETLAQYCVGDGVDSWVTEENTILEWRVEEEPPDEWMEGEGWMVQLLPIRDELVRGDYRSLYIGWLSSVAGRSSEEDWEYEGFGGGSRKSDKSRREPPVPPGLKELTDAQVALAEFLGVSGDLLAAAAQRSPAVPAQPAPDAQMDTWAAQLPEPEVRALLARVLYGEGLRVQTELQSRYYGSRREATPNAQESSVGNRRTAGELAATAAQTARERRWREIEAQERKRHAHLTGLVPRFSDLWATMNVLAQDKKASSYDKIFSLMVDMRDAYTLAGRCAEFDAEFARFSERYSSAALARRLKEV